MPTPRLTVSGEERTRLAEARLGQLVLDRWRLDRLIGVGGMAAVFAATQRNGSRAAIKILHQDLASFEQIRERFLAEGYAANRVSHPGVVTVREEGTTPDGAVFLVMDLLRGQTLAERLEPSAEPLSLGRVLDVATQLLDVLAHAHDRGIVHGDIKPQNVFLTSSGRVKLLDFGIARVASAAQSHATEAGTTLGTPAFMSPEQALGYWSELDGRSDLWSLGATLYLLLSGLPVRESASATQQLLGAMTLPVASLGDVAALPRSVVAVVDRALAFDREDRFPDARAMQLSLRAAQDELSAPGSLATMPPPSLEPMAVSLRTPQPDPRGKRPSIPTVRPVASDVAASFTPPDRAPPSALPLYVTLGFAVGLAIVVAVRPTARQEGGAASAVQPRPAARVHAAPSASSKAQRAGWSTTAAVRRATAAAAQAGCRNAARTPAEFIELLLIVVSEVAWARH